MILIAVVVVSSLVGCETLDNFLKPPAKEKLEKGAHQRLSIHQIVKYPRATKLEKALPTIEGDEKVWVNVNYFIDSHNFKDIKLVEVEGKPGMYDFSIELDERGVLKWLQLSNGFFETPLALVCDGKVLKIITIKERSTEETTNVVIRGPFNFVDAKLVEKYAKHNYEFYTE